MVNEAEREMDEKETDCNQLTFFPALHESFHSEDFLELCIERQIILQEFVESEKVAYSELFFFVEVAFQDEEGQGNLLF